MIRKKLLIDLVMTALILLSFAYQLTGNTVHELLGSGLFAWFIVHNIALNRIWYATLTKGNYGTRRMTSVTVNGLLLATTLIMLVTGTLNSHLLAEALGAEGDVLPREVHTTAAYWFLILMSIHLGMHWRLIMAEARKLTRLSPAIGGRLAFLRFVAALVSCHGIYAAMECNVPAKLVAYFSFDYWDFGASVMGYFAQYLSIIGICVFLTHYCLNWRQATSLNEGKPKLKGRPSRVFR